MTGRGAKGGKGSKADDPKQRKLNMKKVTIGGSSTSDEAAIKALEFEVGKLKEEKRAMSKLIEELTAKDIEKEVRMKALEDKMMKMEEALNAIEIAAVRGGGGLRGGSGTSSERSEKGEEWEERQSSTAGSEWSLNSAASCLSEREVGLVKRLIVGRDRASRRENIVVKGANVAEEDVKKWISEFINDRLGVKASFTEAWKAGPVVVAKCATVESKKEIMKNKAKLKGSKIFIEQDLSYDERKTQEKISRWVKSQKEKGINVKAGFGKVQIGGEWKKWEDVKEEGERGDENGNANF